MINVWEKRPGRWKVSGIYKIFPTKEAAVDAAASLFEIEEIPAEEKIIEETVEEVEPVEEADPLEALKEARFKRDGNIQEGFDYHGDYSE